MSRRNKSFETEIDRCLKAAFSEVENEPLPDRFTDLLNQLRNQSRGDTSAEATDPSEPERGDRAQ